MINLLNMPYRHRVHIRWTRPVHIDEFSGISSVNDCGVYLITRKYIRNDVEWEVLLYVGITKRSFYQRLSEHLRCNSKWCASYGKKYIRFGTISLYKQNLYDTNKLLRDIETKIIQSLNDIYPGELINIQQVSAYNPNYCLDIYHHNNGWLTRFNPK